LLTLRAVEGGLQLVDLADLFAVVADVRAGNAWDGERRGSERGADRASTDQFAPTDCVPCHFVVLSGSDCGANTSRPGNDRLARRRDRRGKETAKPG
jgi:hypothetical protein